MCPTIKLLEKKPFKREEHTATREVRRKAYNNTQWRKLRDTFIAEHPLCYDHLQKGKIVMAEDVHHLDSPFKNGACNMNLLLDENNLVSLCKECHAARHNGSVSTEEIIKQLDALLNNNISDTDIENGDW